MPFRWHPGSHPRGWGASRCARSWSSTSRRTLPVSADAADPVREMVDAVYRAESRRVLATLIRLLGDFDVAEEALHDAFVAALERWPETGIPDNPRNWLVSAGRFRAIDHLRRRAAFDERSASIASEWSTSSDDPSDVSLDGDIPD